MMPGDWLVVGLLALTAVIAAMALIIGTRVPPAWRDDRTDPGWERWRRKRDGIDRDEVTVPGGGNSDQRERAA